VSTRPHVTTPPPPPSPWLTTSAQRNERSSCSAHSVVAGRRGTDLTPWPPALYTAVWLRRVSPHPVPLPSVWERGRHTPGRLIYIHRCGRSHAGLSLPAWPVVRRLEGGSGREDRAQPTFRFKGGPPLPPAAPSVRDEPPGLRVHRVVRIAVAEQPRRSGVVTRMGSPVSTGRRSVFLTGCSGPPRCAVERTRPILEQLVIPGATVETHLSAEAYPQATQVGLHRPHELSRWAQRRQAPEAQGSPQAHCLTSRIRLTWRVHAISLPASAAKRFRRGLPQGACLVK